MNENFLPAPRLGIIGIFDRLDDARCPECGNTATGEDCCECPDESPFPTLEPASEDYEPSPYDGTYSEE
jgi:hypothetical protein